ncbi:GNAT superfamily N-acetyltransferase [Salirhabdus euzebyi]|uniref:GNAT superfamily N-acetyltransferase n=1 Tax=Salirhabdus euzebyi TaxID=394506 RepID=A0A841Q2C0_9BACI|nr:GNAT family N-acetyltransferase [Salirhabdus euzebyi]MBB6452375.1 GNAT superfamily N-acetyltransferase [Salirhabdus euzebyi]
MEIAVQYATKVDLVDLVEVDKETIGNDSRKAYIEDAIKEKRCLVAKRHNVSVGYLIFHMHFFDYPFISLVMVRRTERKKGYAKALMEYVEQLFSVEKIFSSTNQSNRKMQDVFQRVGYERSGVIDNLDEADPELIYVKFLN